MMINNKYIIFMELDINLIRIQITYFLSDILSTNQEMIYLGIYLINDYILPVPPLNYNVLII